MNSTPKGNRTHIVIYGDTNAGKSSLINNLVGEEIALVSHKEGTTTDPVMKAMELIPVGPVLFIDTAGLNDSTELGKIRTKKTLEYMKRTDIAIFLIDVNKINYDSLEESKIAFKKYNIPYILVFNKVDTIDKERLRALREKYKTAEFVSTINNEGIEELKNRLIKVMEREQEEIPIIGDLLPYGSRVILVVPVDSEAPKGRLILPQVQCIRDCLDHGIKSYVVRDTELEEALKEIKDVDLVITDSQAFKKVDKIVPKNILLTSFSMLFARQKGDLNEYLKGVYALRNLKKGDKILIAESCTHNVSHEDIGKVKIPKLINNYLGEELEFNYAVGHEFTEDISKYALVIHCGACMINRRTVINRIKLCGENNIPITNYGVVLSFLTNTLERSSIIFNKNKRS